MALFEFFRRMVFGTDLSPKKIILKGADLLDPYLTQFQFRVELENALMSLYAHPQQMNELRTSMAIAEAPVSPVHDFIQAALRKDINTQQGENALGALKVLLENLSSEQPEMASGIRSAWQSMIQKMQSEESKLPTINDWLGNAEKLLATHSS